MNKNNGSVEPPSMAEDSSASAPESKQPTLLTQILSEDPFDLENIRLDQSKMNAPAAKKLLIKIPVRKPNRQDWIRVNPQLSICAALIDHKETRDQYLVQAKLAPYVEQESYRATLYLTMNRQGVAFFWPVRLPEDGRSNDWNETSRVAAEEAMKNWVRVVSNINLGGYDVLPIDPGLFISEPEWPALGLQELLRIAFKNRLVDSLDHPLLLELQGKL